MAAPLPQVSQNSKPAPFVSFSPDADPTTDGAVQDAFNYFPIAKGFRTFPGLSVIGKGLPSTCFGSFSGLLVATPVFVAATNNALYVADSNNNLQQSATGYTNTVNRWRFTPYGTPTGLTQYLIAADGVDLPQQYVPGVGWSALPNGSSDNSPPPVAAIVAAQDYALVLVPPNSQQFISTFSITPASWASPGSVPNQVYYQQITQSPGNITAAQRLRNTMVFYKPNALHVAYFYGGTVGWDVQDSSIQQGVLSQEWVINTGDMHYFPSLGNHDFWSFDGYNLSPLNNQMSEFFRYDHNDTYMSSMYGAYDAIRSLLVWVYSSNSASPAGTLDTWLIYYVKTGNWSFQRVSIDLPLVWMNPTTLHSELGYFGLDHSPRYYNDGMATGRSYITSNYFGDYRFYYSVDRVRPAFNIMPSSASCTPVNQDVMGTVTGPPGDVASQTGAITQPLTDDGWFNFDQPNTTLIQAYQIVTTGLAEIIEIEPVLNFAGETL